MIDSDVALEVIKNPTFRKQWIKAAEEIYRTDMKPTLSKNRS